MSRTQDVTIHDIARRAGVGVGTVSRVLNDSPNVSEATRAQVRQVMAEANYRPKSAAKTLRTRRSSATRGWTRRWRPVSDRRPARWGTRPGDTPSRS